MPSRTGVRERLIELINLLSDAELDAMYFSARRETMAQILEKLSDEASGNARLDAGEGRTGSPALPT